MPSAAERNFEQIKHGISVLRLRVGLLYLAGESPSNAEGMLRLNHSPGARNSHDKLYFPAEGVDLLEAGYVVYGLPESVKTTPAPYGELLLNMRDGCDVIFGRHGEDEPFTFKDGKYYLPLRIYRHEEHEFNPLFVKVRMYGDGEIFYMSISVCWEDDQVAVACARVAEDADYLPEILREAMFSPAPVVAGS